MARLLTKKDLIKVVVSDNLDHRLTFVFNIDCPLTYRRCVSIFLNKYFINDEITNSKELSSGFVNGQKVTIQKKSDGQIIEDWSQTISSNDEYIITVQQ